MNLTFIANNVKLRTTHLPLTEKMSPLSHNLYQTIGTQSLLFVHNKIHRLLSDVFDAPSLVTSKARLDKALGKLI